MSFVEIKNLVVEYETKKNVFGQKKVVHALNGVDLSISQGEIYAIAGESGCGKSTLSKAIMKLVSVKSGEIFYNGVDVLDKKLNKSEFYSNVQMIFQNPYASLNPKMKVLEILKEPLDINRKDLTESQKFEIVKEKIKQVGLNDDCLKLYPHEFSGGQRQRIAIARALVLNPKFIIADEPVSALDVSIQAQIINLLKQLQKKLGLTLLFISHDLSVMKYISDQIAIMYLGEIVEQGTTEEIFNNPKHPYTQALLNAVPSFDKKVEKNNTLKGELPNPENLPSGCKFHTRCQNCVEKCKTDIPNYTKIENLDNHLCKCFLYE